MIETILIIRGYNLHLIFFFFNFCGCDLYLYTFKYLCDVHSNYRCDYVYQLSSCMMYALATAVAIVSFCTTSNSQTAYFGLVMYINSVDFDGSVIFQDLTMERSL